MIRYYGWKTGSRNVVVLGPLTFKFPKLWLDRLWETLRGRAYTLGWSWYRQSLSVSFGENFTEAKWFFKKKPPQIVPCILPLVIVNVYPTMRGVGALKVQGWLWYVADKFGAVWLPGFSPEFKEAFGYKGCSHTFEHDENYAIHNSEAKLLDYGASGVMELVVNHQEEFAKFLETIKKFSQGQ